VPQRSEVPEIAAGSTTEIKNRVGRVAFYRIEECRVVLADIVVSRTVPEGSCEPIVIRDRRLAEMPEQRALIDRSGMDHGRGVAAAKAEIVWRDREYAEDQENSRREFEREMSAAADAREVNRQKFDEALAQRQMDHSSKLAREQLNTAQAAAKAAKWAAWAAGIAALGAIGQLVVAIVGSLLAEP
jgi:hypothetical protein